MLYVFCIILEYLVFFISYHLIQTAGTFFFYCCGTWDLTASNSDAENTETRRHHKQGQRCQGLSQRAPLQTSGLSLKSNRMKPNIALAGGPHSLSKTTFWLVLCDWLFSDRWQNIKQTGSPAEQRRAVGNSPLCLLQTACAPSITLSLTQPVHNVADKPKGLDQHTQGLNSWLG